MAKGPFFCTAGGKVWAQPNYEEDVSVFVFENSVSKLPLEPNENSGVCLQIHDAKQSLLEQR